MIDKKLDFFFKKTNDKKKFVVFKKKNVIIDIQDRDSSRVCVFCNFDNRRNCENCKNVVIKKNENSSLSSF